MCPLLLRPPRPDDEAVIVGAHAEVRPEGHDFALFFDEEPSYAAWLARIERQTRGIVPQPHLVKSDYLLAEVDGQIVGRVSIRHVLNERLHHQGGHVGYVVRPAFRRRGYATAMLQQGLARLAGLGVDPALVTCNDDNHASAVIIERAGGIVENVVLADGDVALRRYWVPTGPHAGR